MAASALAAALLGENSGGNAPTLYADPNLAQANNNLSLGQALLQQGLSGAPAAPAQALGRLAQVLAGSHLQQSATSDLAGAMSHSVATMAATLPQGHPIRKLLESGDPIAVQQGIQAFQSGVKLLSEGYNLEPGAERKVGGATIGTNEGPQSPEGKLQKDVERAASRQARPNAPVAPTSPVQPSVPLAPPRIAPTGIESVIGGGPATSSSANATPSFNERFAAARPNGVPSSAPTSPLQGAIDVQAQKAGATKAAEENATAGVQYGDLLQPQAPPHKGPGGTEALPTTHGTLIPPVAEQTQWPRNPKELEGTVANWNKTKQDWNTGIQSGYQAEQRLNTIANVFKTMQTGYGAEQKAHIASMLKSVGVNLPESVMGDPAKVETAIHENYVETLQQLKATTPRFTQMEFRALSENKEHPDLQPEANLRMLSEDIAQLRQSRDLPRDFQIAQQHGWRDPNSFEQAWLRQNPLHGYVDQVRKEIGPLKGMAGNEGGAQSAFPGGVPQSVSAPAINSAEEYAKLPKGSPYTAPDGTIRHKQ